MALVGIDGILAGLGSPLERIPQQEAEDAASSTMPAVSVVGQQALNPT
jgi:hypothetical protein